MHARARLGATVDPGAAEAFAAAVADAGWRVDELPVAFDRGRLLRAAPEVVKEEGDDGMDPGLVLAAAGRPGQQQLPAVLQSQLAQVLAAGTASGALFGGLFAAMGLFFFQRRRPMVNIPDDGPLLGGTAAAASEPRH